MTGRFEGIEELCKRAEISSDLVPRIFTQDVIVNNSGEMNNGVNNLLPLDATPNHSTPDVSIPTHSYAELYMGLRKPITKIVVNINEVCPNVNLKDLKNNLPPDDDLQFDMEPSDTEDSYTPGTPFSDNCQEVLSSPPSSGRRTPQQLNLEEICQGYSERLSNEVEVDWKKKLLIKQENEIRWAQLETQSNRTSEENICEWQRWNRPSIVLPANFMDKNIDITQNKFYERVFLKSKRQRDGFVPTVEYKFDKEFCVQGAVSFSSSDEDDQNSSIDKMKRYQKLNKSKEEISKSWEEHLHASSSFGFVSLDISDFEDEDNERHNTTPPKEF